MLCLQRWTVGKVSVNRQNRKRTTRKTGLSCCFLKPGFTYEVKDHNLIQLPSQNCGKEEREKQNPKKLGDVPRWMEGSREVCCMMAIGVTVQKGPLPPWPLTGIPLTPVSTEVYEMVALSIALSQAIGPPRTHQINTLGDQTFIRIGVPCQAWGNSQGGHISQYSLTLRQYTWRNVSAGY
ncbi:hypothetical protein BX600DRAFT_149466 [Xylariales sp. PMI_506]|nr:hypothetical protein BX600DRAFT_149466 [Xylariales sp. PMI_506]